MVVFIQQTDLKQYLNGLQLVFVVFPQRSYGEQYYGGMCSGVTSYEQKRGKICRVEARDRSVFNVV